VGRGVVEPWTHDIYIICYENEGLGRRPVASLMTPKGNAVVRGAKIRSEDTVKTPMTHGHVGQENGYRLAFNCVPQSLEKDLELHIPRGVKNFG